MALGGKGKLQQIFIPHSDMGINLPWAFNAQIWHIEKENTQSALLKNSDDTTRGVSSIGKPCRPEHGFPRPNCPGNALIF